MNAAIYTVYAIRSVNRNYIYIGLTSDLEARLHRHNSGYERTTKPYSPFVLIYKEDGLHRKEARIREKYWKTTCGRKKLKSMLPC
jgi:putative endonuclease